MNQEDAFVQSVIHRVLAERIESVEFERNEAKRSAGEAFQRVQELTDKVRKLEEEIKSLKPPAANPPWMQAADKKPKQTKAS